MRTTITLEPDVAQLIQARMKETNLSFRDTVNSALRRGLTQPKDKEPFELLTFDMGEPIYKGHKWLQLAGELEDEEIIRKMNEGK